MLRLSATLLADLTSQSVPHTGQNQQWNAPQPFLLLGRGNRSFRFSLSTNGKWICVLLQRLTTCRCRQGQACTFRAM